MAAKRNRKTSAAASESVVTEQERSVLLCDGPNAAPNLGDVIDFAVDDLTLLLDAHQQQLSDGSLDETKFANAIFRVKERMRVALKLAKAG